MPALPNVGGDSGIWGTELNTYLEVEHNSSTGALLIRSDGTLLTPTAVKTGNYTAQAGDFIPVDTTSGNVTVSLPSAPTKVVKVGVKMVKQSSTNHVTINCSGSDQFNDDGSTSATLSLLNQGIILQYNPTAARWYVQADDLPLSQLDTRYAANNVLTTLGDIVYENSTPTPARLPGNTTTTKSFLTQTGTGSVSAAPAWGTIASGDLPTGTTSAKGALQLDSTTGNINVDGSQAAGSNGLAADSGHTHPANSGWIPSDNGFQAVNWNPFMTGGNTLTIAGTLYLLKIPVRQQIIATNIIVDVSTTGTGTSSGSYCGIWNSSGTLLVGSSDIASNFTSGGAGFRTLALTSATTLVPATVGGFVWAGFVFNLATTQPNLKGLTSPGTVGLAWANFNLSNTNGLAACVNGLTVTSLGNIVTSSNTATNAAAYWIGIT